MAVEPKGLGLLLLAKHGIKHMDKESDAPESPSQDLPSGLTDAANDLLDAINAKDVDGVAQALSDAFEICGSTPDTASSDSKEDTEPSSDEDGE